jgi:hypothetical protein
VTKRQHVHRRHAATAEVCRMLAHDFGPPPPQPVIFDERWLLPLAFVGFFFVACIL